MKVEQVKLSQVKLNGDNPPYHHQREIRQANQLNPCAAKDAGVAPNRCGQQNVCPWR